MTRSYGARIKGSLAGALALPLVLLAAGCAPGTKDDQKRAAELAEQHAPGRLRVIGARSLFPHSKGSEVIFAVNGDPDAVVRLYVDAGKGRCGGKDCGPALAEALQTGLTRAAKWRGMSAAFQRCGHPVIGVGFTVDAPWIVAEPTNANVTDLLARIGECVGQWARARAETGGPVTGETLSVHMIAPGTARRLPTPDPARPTVLRMSDKKLLAALAANPYHTATYTLPDGGGVPEATGLRITFPYEQRRDFAKTVQGAVGTWLRTSSLYPDAAVSEYQGIWRMELDRVDRLKGHVLFCERKPKAGLCQGEHAVAVTADLRGEPVGPFKVIPNVRQGSGPLRLPPN